MKLLIDIGNTRIKTALFSKSGFSNHSVVSTLDEVKELISKHDGEVILSSVRKLDKELFQFLDEKNVLVLSHQTPLPIKVNYRTPETLGVDRIAAACGSWEMKKASCLIVDIGTCITLDFLSLEGEFLGGNISPGPDLRFRSMNNFTSALPLEKLNKENSRIGHSTKSALQIGVKEGILHEIQGTYDWFKEKNKDSFLVLTGGYSSYFDSNLKGSIFAEPNLVFIGLKSILDYNVKA